MIAFTNNKQYLITNNCKIEQETIATTVAAILRFVVPGVVFLLELHFEKRTKYKKACTLPVQFLSIASLE